MSDKPPPAVIAVLAVFCAAAICLIVDRVFFHILPEQPCPKMWVTDDTTCLRQCMLASYGAESQYQARQQCLKEICNSKQVCKP